MKSRRTRSRSFTVQVTACCTALLQLFRSATLSSWSRNLRHRGAGEQSSAVAELCTPTRMSISSMIAMPTSTRKLTGHLQRTRSRSRRILSVELHCLIIDGFCARGKLGECVLKGIIFEALPAAF